MQVTELVDVAKISVSFASNILCIIPHEFLAMPLTTTLSLMTDKNIVHT